MKSKETDERSTPAALFDPLDKIFHFELDAAATSENAKCPVYITKESDALSLPSWEPYRSIFCNPPYSRGQFDLWLPYAVKESDRGAVVVCVLRGDTSVNWFKIVWRRARYIVFCGRRYRFNSIGPGAKFPTILAVFDPRPQDLEIMRGLGKLGEVKYQRRRVMPAVRRMQLGLVEYADPDPRSGLLFPAPHQHTTNYAE